MEIRASGGVFFDGSAHLPGWKAFKREMREEKR